MKKLTTKIRLTPAQACEVIEKHYPHHLNFYCPVEERTEDNPEWIDKEKHEKHMKLLYSILTAPIGTEITITSHYGSGRLPGYTSVYPSAIPEEHLTQYRSESQEAVMIAQCFAHAQSFGWFKSKYPF